MTRTTGRSATISIHCDNHPAPLPWRLIPDWSWLPAARYHRRTSQWHLIVQDVIAYEDTGQGEALVAAVALVNRAYAEADENPEHRRAFHVCRLHTQISLEAASRPDDPDEAVRRFLEENPE